MIGIPVEFVLKKHVFCFNILIIINMVFCPIIVHMIDTLDVLVLSIKDLSTKFNQFPLYLAFLMIMEWLVGKSFSVESMDD